MWPEEGGEGEDGGRGGERTEREEKWGEGERGQRERGEVGRGRERKIKRGEMLLPAKASILSTKRWEINCVPQESIICQNLSECNQV